MESIYWYCALGVVGAGVTVWVLCKKKDYYKNIMFFLFAMMFAFVCEMIVLLFFDSYSYRPGIYTDYYAENIFGHIIPNATLWPAVALLVAACSLRYRWVILIAVIFTILDILYTSLGIYVHNWWQTWMTTVGGFGYLALMQKWYFRLSSNRTGVLRFITFWFALLVILKLPISMLLLTGTQLTYIGWFENLYRDSGVFSVSYNTALTFLCTFFIFVLKKWYWKLIPFLIYFVCDRILLSQGILLFYDGWNIWYLMLVRCVSLGAFIGLERKYPYNPASRRSLAV